jgi:von Willebrand factor type A domain
MDKSGMRVWARLLVAVAMLFGAVTSTAAAAPANPVVDKSVILGSKKKVEIVFAIDTTGSMGGLIDGAKRKIWAIAQEVARAKEQPEVRMGLVAFRDRGDAYVTQVTPLTDNLDAIYETLMGLSANGGGDGPEDVNSALHDSLNSIQWSNNKDTLKLIFLVGDAPPHMDYSDQVQWPKTAQSAVRQNIYINTIQCGDDSSTHATWQKIAHAAEGRYARIAQTGGVAVAIATPYDDDLRRLGDALDATNMTYGRGEERAAKVATRNRANAYAAAAPVASSADRAVAKMSTGSGMRSSEDLVSLAESSGLAAALDSMTDDNMPDELRGKTKEQQTAIISEQQQKRALTTKQIQELRVKREKFLQHAAKEKAKDGKAATDGFDSEVVEMLRAQATSAGLSY